MIWKQIWQKANYVLYSMQGGKASKSSIGFVEFQEKMRNALAIHTRITWAYLDDDKQTAIEELNNLLLLDESVSIEPINYSPTGPVLRAEKAE